MSHRLDSYSDLIEALLSPLNNALLDPWRNDVIRHLMEATRADAAAFFLIEDGATPILAVPSEGIDDPGLDWIGRMAAGDAGDGIVMEDMGGVEAVGVTAPPIDITGRAVLVAFKRSHAGWVDSTAELMRTMNPAFRSGVNLRRRFGAGRAALARTLDGLNQMLLLCDDAGRGLHANRALAAAQNGVSRSAVLEGLMETFARNLAHSRPWDGDAGQSAVAERRVSTATGDFRLRGSHIAERVFGGGCAILIAAEPRASSGVDPEELQMRFGLTSRQAETARLLASGRSNAEIAERLGVSPFTVQKHVRKVLEKLEISTRSQVAAALSRTR